MGRAFICRCEDIDHEEVMEAIHDGYDDLESLRRFTALGTGPCQGKACLQECIRILAAHHGVPEGAVGLMTLRPPVIPIPLGHLACLDTETLAHLGGDVARAAGTRLAATDDTPKTGRATPARIARDAAASRGGGP